MFRKMRNKKKELSEESAKRLLREAPRGIIAVNGDEGYPYAVPINYLYDEERNRIYFHGLRSGYKVDSLKVSDKICFTVYGNETIKEESWAPFVQSVVVFGRCRTIENRDDMLEALKNFAMKYYPNEKMVLDEIKATGNAVQMFEIEIEHLTGKEVQEK
ncbi:pyridoxamine 5'-phosphate oxidase family protein [Mogibacterium pumilum]|uniref:5-nitroimidazole antibiotic resistance protein n=1 Tax=Mogibacterium pumilum TaxID=86332 RepID=A0A223ARD2_9FIRM|nr:pyridoxamine 5'-phosphate oxidase family protein [Mogibacterium pumilum]ASS37521.1 5-nitroimidazole antibiotic resistance protein [Mogibacterium pumilum]